MSSRAMSSKSTYSFGLLEKCIRLRIYAGAGSWATPFLAAGRGINTNNAAFGVPDGAGAAGAVTRLSAGKFQITLDDAYLKLVTAQATYAGSGDAEDLVAQVGLIGNLGTSTPTTVIVKTKTGAVNTDPGTTDANTFIAVDLVFEDSAA